MIQRDHNSLIYDLVFGDVEKIDVYTVFEAARNNDRQALKVLKDAAEYLGMAVSSVINLMDPQLIIFEGKVCRTGDVFMSLFEQALNERYAGYIDNEFEIVIGKGSSNMASILYWSGSLPQGEISAGSWSRWRMVWESKRLKGDCFYSKNNGMY